MRPYAVIDDRHLEGATTHRETLRFLEPEVPPRILAVDDDDAVLDLLADTLGGEHYQVDVARSSEDALPLLLFHDYRGVLIDLVLPDRNGLALYRQIARRRPALRSRVIFLTGALNSAEAVRLVRLVDTPVLLKPFDPGDLVAAVHRIAAPDSVE